MTLIELLIIALGLSADAFAVSIGKGLLQKGPNLHCAFLCGAWFGAAQAVMPLLGYLLGSTIGNAVASFDHWIAFGLLVFIGVKAIIEGVKGNKEESAALSARAMFIAAVATSIDALAVGVTLSFFEGNILISTAIIGLVTFIISFTGAMLGSAIGKIWQKGAQIFGGAVLAAIGVKILIEHLLQGK